MMCIVTTKIKGKTVNKMYIDDLSRGIKYMIEVLKNYNAVSQIYNGFWKKGYDLYTKRYLNKKYIVITDLVTLELYCRGSKEVDTSFFVEMIKAMERNETF